MNAIPSHERLIVALDVPDAQQARALVTRIGEPAVFYKIGMELLMAPGFFELLDWLKGQDKKVFVDLKFFDIPETVARAVRNLAERGADFCTIHGNQSIMEAAADLVLSRARRALQAGCDGVVSSGLEVERLRAEAPRELICVTPGIRPVENRVEADQKRIMTPAAAIKAGADYLVVGRPIRDAADPRGAVVAIQSEISEALHA